MLKMSIYRQKIALIAVSAVVLCAIFIPAINGYIDESRANDGNSAYYLNFGRNLTRYPVSTTKLLSIHLVGDGSPVIIDDPVTFYLDHPPGLSWAVATALEIKSLVWESASSISFARWVSVLPSIGIALMVLWLAMQEFGVAVGAISLVGFITSPVFFSHGVVINFEPLCCALMLAGYLTRNPLAMIPSLLTDWPAYFLLLAQSYREERQLLRKKAALYLFVGLISGLAVIFYHQLVVHQPSFFISFIIGSFRPQGAFSRILHWSTGTKPFFELVSHNFGWLNLLILAFGVFQWLKNFRNLSNLYYLALSFVFVTALNVILFLPWALEHSFWTYYLIVPIAVSWITLWQHLPKKWWIVVPVVLCLAKAYFPYKSLIADSPTRFAEQQCPILLKKPMVPIYTDQPSIYFGHGYVARWYFDQPVKKLADLTSADCTLGCIWISDHPLVEGDSLKKKSSCNYANIWIDELNP
jgi:hypothetical protein